MDKKKIGQVTPGEKDELLLLFERKSALQELLMAFDNISLTDQSKNDLYEKIIADMGAATFNLDNWWKSMSQKYSWESSSDGRWDINFNTNEIFLTINDR